MILRDLKTVAAFAVAVILAPGAETSSAQQVPGNSITLNANGGWCWFQDERAVVDEGRIVFGSVASPSGDVTVTTYDVASGKSVVVTLHAGLGSDDHNTPALLILPDGRYLAVYSRHGADRLMRWRLSTKPHDASSWEPERTVDVGAGMTYSNLFRLSMENNRIYNFHRGRGYDPSYMVSEDAGATWSYGGHLLANANDPKNRIRPYLKYASNNTDAVHFIASEAHPQESSATSIYHGYLKGGKVYRSDGTLVGSLSDGPVEPTNLTRVFAGDAKNKAWTSDIHLDGDGRPYIAYSVHKSSEDHRYRYARWDGTRWHDFEISFGGRRLYRGEEHYTGNIALDPNDPDTVYVSADVDPSNGQPLRSSADGLRHYELFKGTTPDHGRSWAWTPLTKNSSMDNIRPVVPVWNKRQTAILWLRGSYRSYTDYDLEVVGIVVRDR